MIKYEVPSPTLFFWSYYIDQTSLIFFITVKRDSGDWVRKARQGSGTFWVLAYMAREKSRDRQDCCETDLTSLPPLWAISQSAGWQVATVLCTTNSTIRRRPICFIFCNRLKTLSLLQVLSFVITAASIPTKFRRGTGVFLPRRR
jgi:hypothetical protein